MKNPLADARGYNPVPSGRGWLSAECERREKNLRQFRLTPISKGKRITNGSEVIRKSQIVPSPVYPVYLGEQDIPQIGERIDSVASRFAVLPELENLRLAPGAHGKS